MEKKLTRKKSGNYFNPLIIINMSLKNKHNNYTSLYLSILLFLLSCDISTK